MENITQPIQDRIAKNRQSLAHLESQIDELRETPLDFNFKQLFIEIDTDIFNSQRNFILKVVN